MKSKLLALYKKSKFVEIVKKSKIFVVRWSDQMQYVEKELTPDTKIPIRIGFIKPNGVPSIISLWYIDINGKIYCATQKTAKILH